jgi:hypothetical protein
MSTILPATVHLVTCNRCRAGSGPGETSAQLSWARDHEARHSGHRATVWDSPTSQIPRSFWTEEIR